MLVLLDVCVQVPNIEQERRTLAIVEVWQKPILNETPELPFAHAQVLSSLAGTEEAVLERRSKTHWNPFYRIMLDNTALDS